MNTEVVNAGSVDPEAFKKFIHLIGVEFENWKEDQNEEKKEVGTSGVLL